MPARRRSPTPWLVAAAVLTGCPSPVETPYGSAKRAPPPQVDESDPRVVKKDGELYAQKTIERAEERSRDDSPPGLGSGRPDETNGSCRLYAPKLPEPKCCQLELGFDVETVQAACGHGIYLGESFRFSCGFYFHNDAGPRWFRLSRLPNTEVAAAVDHHDRKMADTLGDKYTPSSPVPGVEGAMWSRHEKYRWAFLPGWPSVRQLSWEAASCSDEGIIKVIAQIVAAKPPDNGEKRLGLIPKARM